MDSDEADELLAEADCVEYAVGAIGYIKELRSQCLEADIPAGIGPVDGGDPYRGALIVRADDYAQVTRLMQDDWIELVEQEGTAGSIRRREDAGADPDAGDDEDDDAEPACPACGLAAPLVDGACSDCGLQLA